MIETPGQCIYFVDVDGVVFFVYKKVHSCDTGEADDVKDFHAEFHDGDGQIVADIGGNFTVCIVCTAIAFLSAGEIFVVEIKKLSLVERSLDASAFEVVVTHDG